MPVTIKLTKPLVGGKVTEFTFREPRFADYLTIGDPRAPIINGDKVYMRSIPEAVKDYSEKLLVEGDPAVMGFACLRDSMAIEKAILGFFQDAESVAPETKTTSSSSDGDSPS